MYLESWLKTVHIHNTIMLWFVSTLFLFVWSLFFPQTCNCLKVCYKYKITGYKYKPWTLNTWLAKNLLIYYHYNKPFGHVQSEVDRQFSNKPKIWLCTSDALHDVAHYCFCNIEYVTGKITIRINFSTSVRHFIIKILKIHFKLWLAFQ